MGGFIPSNGVGIGGTTTPDSTTQERIPYKNSGTFEDSPLYYDVSEDKIVSDVTLEVPPGTIIIGETTDLSACTGTLIVTDQVNSKFKYIIESEFNSTGSELPVYLNLGTEFVLNVQTDFSETLTANPLTYSVIGTVVAPSVRQINATTFKTGAILTNLRARFIDNATGVVMRYIPSKAEWDANTGVTTISGDNVFNFLSDAADSPGVFNLGINPFLIENSQQIDIEIEADSINILGDLSGDPYQVADVQDGPYVTLPDKETADRHQTTGLLEGGVISIATGTTVDWTSGRGIVADYTDPENPDITDVSWDAVSGQSVTNVATDGTTIFGYDSAGSLVQILATAISISDAHNYIFFASATHFSSTIVSVLTAPGNIGYDGIGSYSDFINLVIGPANIDGNVYGANGTNLNIDVVGGNAYMIGSNFRNDPKISDIITLANDTALSFQKVYRSADPGLSMLYDGASTTTIDPSQYDNGTGTLVTTTTDYWTIQRIFRSRAGTTFVAYGQQEFSTKSIALEAKGAESFTEKSPLPFMLYRCSLVVKEGATDLSDTDEAEFFAEGSFRSGGAQSATATIPGITSPGGVNKDVQFNNSGVFGGDSNFTYDTTTKELKLNKNTSDTTVAGLTIEQDGTGDALQHFVLTGTKTWSIGVDNNNGDRFKITHGNDLSNDESLLLDPLTGMYLVHDNNDTGSTEFNGITMKNTSGGDNTYTSIVNVGAGSNIASFIKFNNEDFSADYGSIIFGAKDSTGLNPAIMKVTASGVVVGDTAPISSFHVYDSNTETGAGVGLTIEQNSTGDAVAHFKRGSNYYSAGIDYSDSELFKISASADLGTSPAMTFSTDQWARVHGNLGLGDGTGAPVSPLHIYTDDTATTISGITLEQDGTGDALMHFILTGVKTWSIGIDNSNADRFKITHGNDLNNDESLLLDPDTGMYLVHDNADTGSTEFNGITMKNTSGGDNTYTSIVNVGDNSIIASLIKFNNDDFSEDYGSIIFGARNLSGLNTEVVKIDGDSLTVEGSIYPSSDVFGYMKNGTAGFAEGHISTGEFIGTTIPLTATGIIYSVYWGKDGLRLFVTTEDEYIYQYDLTIPYDITSATYAGSNNFTLVSSTGAFQLWNNDGTILWHGGRQVNKVSFTNPWEISSISGDVIEANVSFRNPFHLWDLRWKSDGTKYYGVGYNLDAPFANLSAFVEWEVVTPFNLSTKTTTDALNIYAFPTGIPSIATGQLGFDIRPDGKRCYVFRPSTGVEYEIVLATAWDFSDTTLVNTVTRTQHTDTTNFAMSPDATTITGITPAGLIVQKKLGLEANILMANSVVDTPLVNNNSDIRLRSNTGDVIAQIDSSSKQFEILGLNHTDSDAIINIATVDGDASFYVGEDTPVGNVSATGGSFYFRDDELDTDVYVKRSTGAPSTSGWVSVSGISGPGSSTLNSIAIFDVTDGSSISDFSNAKLIESGIITKLDIEAPASPGTAGVSFCDSSSVEQGSIGWADATPDVLFIISPNSDISYTSGGGVHAFKSGNSSFNFLRVRSPGVTASAGIIIEDSGAGGPLSMLYHESIDTSVIQDNSSTGLNIETGNRIKFQTASSHTIPLLLLEATGAGGADIAVHVGDENPEGTITTTPGGLYARANGVNSSLNIHKAAGSGNTGWKKLLDETDNLNATTGWLEGGQVTINGGDTSKLDISAGTAIIVDMSTPDDPSFETVTWTAQTAFDPSLSGRSTWIGVQSGPTFVAITDPTPTNLRNTAILARVWDTSGTGPTITNIGDYERPTWGLSTAFQDFITKLGSWNISGNVFSANNSNLLLDKSAGTSFRYHSEDTIGSENVHTDSIATGITSYNYHLQGSGATTTESTIDPDNYDNVGSKTAIPTGQWTIQEIWTFPVSGTVHVLYGQEIYPSKVNALSAIDNEQKVRNDEILDGSIFRAYLVVQEGMTNLDDAIFRRGQSLTEPAGGEGGNQSFVTRSYAISDYGTSDEFYVAGFYEADVSDTTLTIGGTVTETFGGTNRASGAHAFCVASGAGGTDLVLTVTGTSITDNGVRTTSDSEIIVADTDSAITDQFFETSKKWLGVITYTLTGTTGSFTFNYGFCKYEDFGNRVFTVTDFEVIGLAAGAASNFDMELLHHSAVGWTYSAGAFVPGGNSLVDMATDYSTDRDIDSDQYFAYKRANLSDNIDGSSSEGVVVRLTQTTNNSIRYATAHIGVLI